VNVGAAAVVKKPFNGKKEDLKNPPTAEEEEKKNDVMLAHCSRNMMFTPLHFSFYFCFKNKDQFVCLAINIPKGVTFLGFDGTIHALASNEHCK
jgi:hypothetical protein